MKYFINYIIIFFLLASCTSSQNASPSPEPTQIIDLAPRTANVRPTATTVAAPTRTATVVIPPTPILITATLTQIPCDPRTADYCITDGHFILQRPIKPPANDSVDTTYRYASTAEGTRDPHHGVEFLNKFGTPVYAAADGTVLFAGPDIEAIYSPWQNFYGNLVVIQHADDLCTLYAHLSKIDVQPGEVVPAGEKIGEVGQSGVATGSHLHFEVRRGDVQNYGSTQNPELWLLPEKDEFQVQYGVVMISIRDEQSQLRYAEMTLGRALESSDLTGMPYYLNTYVNDMAVGEENAAMSDLPPGRYRIALEFNGYLYERWVEVQSGKLTQVVIIVQ
jgi:hypothetical protein